MLLVYITCAGNEEAEKIATTIVSEKLAACVNYFPTTSIFVWKGKTEKTGEIALICKTTRGRLSELKTRVEELHSYEVPAILALDVADGCEEFISWVEASVR